MALPNAMEGWLIEKLVREKLVRNTLGAHWTQKDAHARVHGANQHIDLVALHQLFFQEVHQP
jgi:hypothetical protein